MARVLYLHEYIAQIGEAAAAKRLGITPRVARSYKHRTREPRLNAIPDLIEKSGRVLTLESFFPPPRDIAENPVELDRWDQYVLTLASRRR